MVLQRGTTVPVFGTGTPGDTITVSFLNQNLSTTVAANGTWQVNLASMTASNASNTLTVSETGQVPVTFTGVQVGEVWLCSGQSNMGKPLSYADNSAPYISDAGNHDIRLFQMTAGNGPATSSWQISNSTTAANFSAVGYWFGLDLQEDMNVPVGLIQATHDGTAISHWEHTDGGTGDDYDAMVKAIQPFAVKGVLWYQGESNGGDASYQKELTDMIGEWRSDWGLSALPFGVVQLPSSKWTIARIAQLHTVETVAHTYLVVTSDLPNSDQLHPTDKYPVGIRSSIGARGSVYGESIEWSGPMPQYPPNSFASGSTVVTNFNHLGNGLTTSNGAAPSQFTIAGSNGHYSSATAVIVGNTVQATNGTATPKHEQYSFGSSSGNLGCSVNIPTEGGTKSVTFLPGTLFQIDLP
jgi:sialate O-acetylesterase